GRIEGGRLLRERPRATRGEKRRDQCRPSHERLLYFAVSRLKPGFDSGSTHLPLTRTTMRPIGMSPRRLSTRNPKSLPEITVGCGIGTGAGTSGTCARPAATAANIDVIHAMTSTILR